MSDPDNLLLDLELHLEDADEHLARAINAACDLTLDDHERGDPGWPLLGEVLDQVEALQRLLRYVMRRPELVAAFAAARAGMDAAPDHADRLP